MQESASLGTKGHEALEFDEHMHEAADHATYEWESK